MTSYELRYLQFQYDVNSWGKITLETIFAVGIATIIYAYGLSLFR